MSHHRTAALPIVLLVLAMGSASLFGQAASQGSDLKSGIDQFRNGQYDKAILFFHNVILDPNASADKAAAYFLIAKAYMAVGKLDDAERNLEFYLANYAGSSDYEEASYQKGRLLFLQDEYQNAIQVLQGFLSSYPQSAFASSAWFWIAESLYHLGRLDDAQAAYRKILSDYPTSVKVEAAQYKLTLIQLLQRQDELSKLLTWSHEELLRNVQEYQNREKVYVQAIEAYQKRLAAASSQDDRKIIADLQKQLAQKSDELAQLRAGSPTAATSGGSTSEATQRLLAAKEEALRLKEIYLEWLAANRGSGK